MFFPYELGEVRAEFELLACSPSHKAITSLPLCLQLPHLC